jgi:hypothetical protein
MIQKTRLVTIQYDILTEDTIGNHFNNFDSFRDYMALPPTLNDQNNCLLDILFNSEFLKSAY